MGIPARTPQRLLIVTTLVCLLTPTTTSAVQPMAMAAEQRQPVSPAAGTTHTVTLLTGDRVEYQDLPNGNAHVVVDAAPRRDHAPVVFTTSSPAGNARHRALFVIPSDAERYLANGTLDRALFDVRTLTREGLDDRNGPNLPVIVSYRGKSPTRALPGSRPMRALPAVRGAALRVDRRAAARFWTSLKPVGAVTSRGPSTLGSGIAKVWLDHRIRASLDHSVPQINAPAAWQAGYDGTGVAVAVLDTGIDHNHADLRGKIVSSADFSDSGSTTDRHGHGTHVAATIAGTGLASAGRYRGVAPGARLMIGKVLGDDGSGWDSSVIAGMEWAARGGAKVINLSLGGGVTDGTDPLSEAVNSLTAQTGALFVAAAGNSGAATTIATPGTADAALTVGAVDRQDHTAGFSSRGPRLRDGAAKPEIVAPGVGIVAARAAGTLSEDAVNDKYATLSGTSMATPHVAGAAAILAQRHPTWRATQLKSGLTTTATDSGAAWSAQGAGRVDVAQAVHQDVFGPSAVNFGRLARSSAPSRRPLVYTNHGRKAVVLDLSLSLTGWNGRPAPSGMARLSARTLALEASESASVDVVVDPAASGAGAFGGVVVATTPDRAVSLRSMVTAYLASETATVTVRVTNFRGEPAPFAAVSLIDAAYDPAAHNDPFASPLSTVLVANGVGSANVRRGGVYTALTSQTTYDVTARRVDVMVTPEIPVEAPVEVALDARRGQQHRVTTMEPTDALMSATEVVRTTRGGIVSVLTAVRTDPHLGVYLTPAPVPRFGQLDTYDKRTFASAGLRIETTAGASAATAASASGGSLHPTYDSYRTPAKLAGHRVATVAWAGEGKPGDISGIDLRGRIALIGIRIPDATENPIGYAAQAAFEATATMARAGATAVLVYVDVRQAVALPRPSADPVPQLVLAQSDGLLLRDRLSRSPVFIALTGTPNPRAMYNLFYSHEGVPTGHSELAVPARLVTIPTRYHADRPMTYESNWYAFGARSRTALRERVLFQAPVSRIEYVGPGDPTVQWNRWVTQNEQPPNSRPLIASLVGRDRYAASDRQRSEERWYEGPVLENEPAGAVTAPCGLCRGGPGGDLFIPAWHLGDSTDDHTIQSWPDYRSRVHLFRGPVEVPSERLTNDLPMPTFRLAPQLETYRMVVDGPFPWNPGVRPTQHVTTEWTFRSERPSDPRGACPGTLRGGCVHQPLIQVKYRVGLDLANRAPVGQPQRFTVSAAVPPGAAGAGRIAGLRLWTSTDAGYSWREAEVRAEQGGRYHVTVVHPTNAGHGAAVWTKVQAWDSVGNRVEQTIRAAYSLANT